MFVQKSLQNSSSSPRKASKIFDKLRDPQRTSCDLRKGWRGMKLSEDLRIYQIFSKLYQDRLAVPVLSMFSWGSLNICQAFLSFFKIIWVGWRFPDEWFVKYVQCSLICFKGSRICQKSEQIEFHEIFEILWRLSKVYGNFLAVTKPGFT